MPNSTEESNQDRGRRSGSTASIAAWWNKFHFSGRVIMCSVLFGLGLVLIGGLVFAINMDGGSSDSTNSISEPLPTKAPSKYVGPAIMGIGGFIVTVGIIMCLFETQVCRKKSGDSSPLISDKADPEAKNSDSLTIPSSSHGQKNRKHGKHSPRKAKSKHAKSNSKEKSQQKSPSPRSPPVSIHQSKKFMTSSEENFLTPPNVPNTSEQTKSNKAENPASSSLMKSFTSSDPSWNQSTEFLTPSTSFKDTSLSLNSSVEVNEKQEEVNFKSSEAEYMTPLSVEEERIQKLLIRVKNEQKEVAKREMEEKMSELDDSARHETHIADSSNLQNENIKKDIEFVKKAENINISTDAASLDDASSLNDISQSPKLKNNDGLSENVNSHKEKTLIDKCINSNVHAESLLEKDEVEKQISHTANDNNNVNSPVQDDDNLKVSSVSDDSTALLSEAKDSVHHFGKEMKNDEATENDLENSVSSDETVVSPDFTQRFLDKSKNNESIESTLEENPHASDHFKPESDLDYLSSAKAAEDSSNSDSLNILSDEKNRNKEESSEIGHKDGDSKTDIQSETSPPGDSR